jgi:hypothetical protein
VISLLGEGTLVRARITRDYKHLLSLDLGFLKAMMFCMGEIK